MPANETGCRQGEIFKKGRCGASGFARAAFSGLPWKECFLFGLFGKSWCILANLLQKFQNAVVVAEGEPDERRLHGGGTLHFVLQWRR